MNKSLVLTGCAGFIGLNFLKYAISKGITDKYEMIYSIDKLGYATQYNVGEYKKTCLDAKIKMLHLPIEKLKNSRRTLNIDESTFDVVNFASESHVDRSISAPLGIFLENTAIPAHLLNVLGREKVGKFVHISTDEVYGDLEQTTPYEEWFHKDSNFHPNNPYAASKASQDLYLMSMQRTFGMNVQFIRLANQFGPYQHPEKMLPVSIVRALSGNPIKIYGDGTNIRQWTPVSQSVQVIYDLLFSDSTETVLVAKKYTPLLNNNEVVDIWRGILLDRYGVETEIEYIEDRLGHDLMYALQTTDEVDGYFDTPLVTEFNDTIRHYVDNKEHYLEPV